LASKQITRSTSTISSPSSPIDVATKTLYTPDRNFCKWSRWWDAISTANQELTGVIVCYLQNSLLSFLALPLHLVITCQRPKLELVMWNNYLDSWFIYCIFKCPTSCINFCCRST
jgi:hypothetical protein